MREVVSLPSDPAHREMTVRAGPDVPQMLSTPLRIR